MTLNTTLNSTNLDTLVSTHMIISCFQAEYTSIFPYFDFDSDMDPWTVARAFAKEPWSKEYFERIRQ